MARVVHRTDDILDAAARLARDASVEAVTTAAVIREAGVSSGSVYYRFPTRSALLATLWNRAVSRFHEGAYPLFDDDPVEAAAALGRHTVSWSRASTLDACVLLPGLGAFEPAAWPPELAAERVAEERRWNAAIRQLVRGLRSATGRPTEELLLIAVDLPYAAVRRYLAAGSAVPAGLPATVERVIRASLTPSS
jgi:AcrR family transcriptional regulator